VHSEINLDTSLKRGVKLLIEKKKYNFINRFYKEAG